jgi:exopolysaccharide biosynthesis operon protein EpsL
MDNKRQRRLAVLAGGLVTLLGFQAASAVAQEGSSAQDEKSPFTFSASQSFSRDSNLYRLPDECPGSTNPNCSVPKGKRSDTVSATSAGINFDKQYSRQAFHAGLAVNHSIYSTHSRLNNTAPSARLNWDWRIGNRWSGVLGYSFSESFVGFDNTHAGANPDEQNRVMRRLGRANASADFWWHPNWATGFGYSDVRNDYRKNARPNDEYNAQEASLNFTFRPSTGNRVILSYRAENGQYPNRPKDQGSLRDWKRRDVRLSSQWRLTGVTQLNGYVGYTTRKYDLAPSRDFSGVTGKFGFLWTPTGKAIIDLSWRREIGADADSVSNYAVSQGWALRPTWVITSKVRLGANYEYLERDYRGDPGLGSSAVPRDAKTTSYGLDLKYLPVSYADIGIGYQHQKRDAKEDDRYGYRNRTVWLSGGLTF